MPFNAPRYKVSVDTPNRLELVPIIHPTIRSQVIKWFLKGGSWKEVRISSESFLLCHINSRSQLHLPPPLVKGKSFYFAAERGEVISLSFADSGKSW